MTTTINFDNRAASGSFGADGTPNGYARVRDLLLADPNAWSDKAMPNLLELTTAVTTLSQGSKEKVLLPVGDSGYEFALERRAEQILASVYSLGAESSVFQLNRQVSLRSLKNACADALSEYAGRIEAGTQAQIALRIADRARAIDPTPQARRQIVTRQFHVDPPKQPVAFGYEVKFSKPVIAPRRQQLTVDRADTHALLFSGRLWAWINGKRVPLASGPIMLVVERMMAAAARLETQRVRTRLSDLVFGIEQQDEQKFALFFEHESDLLRVENLEVHQIVAPIVETASRLLQALIAVDRQQNRNLRVTALRREIREIRRRFVRPARATGFVNDTPDRIPESVQQPLSGARTQTGPTLRYREAWTVEVPDVDASRFFFCGDKVILGTVDYALALDARTGDILWARDSQGVDVRMLGRSLIFAHHNGRLELCDLGNGEAHATTWLEPTIVRSQGTTMQYRWERFTEGSDLR